MAERPDIRRAADLALSGDWHGAHAIAQSDESDALACWLHACLHKIEREEWNARYWYARTEHRFEDFSDANAELKAIRRELDEKS